MSIKMFLTKQTQKTLGSANNNFTSYAPRLDCDVQTNSINTRCRGQAAARRWLSEGSEQRYKPQHHLIKNKRGLSLIEILVTVLVINIGVIAMAKLQFKNYEQLSNTILSIKATFYTEALAQKLNINSTLAKTSNSPYLLPEFTNEPDATADSAVCISSSCDADNLAIYDMNTWLHKVKNNFPNGKAQITKTDDGSNSLYTITIQWQYKSEIKQYQLLTQI